MDTSKSLKIALVKRGMKQKELAEKLGKTPQKVSNWISTGTMSRANMVEICNVLDMQVSEFIALGED